MTKDEIRARVAHLNDLALQLELASRRLLDDLRDDVVDSDDE
jgi:hypothetical protein